MGGPKLQLSLIINIPLFINFDFSFKNEARFFTTKREDARVKKGIVVAFENP